MKFFMISALVSALMLINVSALTLENFPDQFTDLQGFYIVLGLDAETIDAVASEAMGLHLYGVNARNNITVQTRTILDTDTLLGSESYIIIGGPCVNMLAFELYGRPENCTQGFIPGQAHMRLFVTNHAHALVIAGYSGLDTLRAVQFAITYQLPNQSSLIIDTQAMAIIETTPHTEPILSLPFE